jgi:hypothetical protein
MQFRTSCSGYIVVVRDMFLRDLMKKVQIMNIIRRPVFM